LNENLLSELKFLMDNSRSLAESSGMSINFQVVVCSFGAVTAFFFAYKLRTLKLALNPPKSRAGLTYEQRQKKVRVASWLSVAAGGLMLRGAILFAVLGNAW
jgi:hypothetical protein